MQSKFSSMKRPLLPFLWLMALVSGLLVVGTTSADDEVKTYRPPNFEKEIFDVDAVGWDRFDRAAVVKLMINIARDFGEEDDVDLEVRAKALAIGYRLDPGSKEIERVDKQLRNDAESVSGEDVDRERLVRRLVKKIDTLISAGGKESFKCAAYCADIGKDFQEDEEAFTKQLATLKEKGAEPDWKGVLEAPVKIVKRDPANDNPEDIIRRIIMGGQEQEKFEPKWVTMPGGDADKLALRMSTVKGLVVMTLSNGDHAGAASTIDVTALKDDEAGDDLIIGIDQKVGSMMRGSIEEVVKLMRLRHEDDGTIPSGYKIEFGFPDKDQLKDGPSAGTAFALVLDSMFTGVKLDPDFACTGAITKIGSVQPIGGVAAKIRGATKKGCRVVGVPIANEKGVADVVVLGEMDQLLAIQIFTMTNFDEALAIARVEREEDVQKTMDLFNKVAEVIQERGMEVVKHPKVIEKLEVVLKRMPNHASAKYLLQYAKGTAPKTLSIGGAFQETRVRSGSAFEILAPLMYEAGEGEEEDFSFDDTMKEAGEEATKQLKEIEGKIDERLRPYFKSVIACTEALAKGPLEEETGALFKERVRGLFKEMISENKKIANDPEIREEMM